MSIVDDNEELCPPTTEEEELTLPRASINKMIKELVIYFRFIVYLELFVISDTILHMLNLRFRM